VRRFFAFSLVFIAFFSFPAHAAELPGTVVRGYEPPAHRYGPGHRGIEFEAPPGSQVRAVAAGFVTFAGTVAHRKFVTVRAGQNLVTYAYLASITVATGDRIRIGDRVGATYGRWHLGLRVRGEYADPMALFGGPPRVHLVPINAAKGTG
jgi:murein DD-endopeptidase MepM/ murein hydrolase activator NlpD